MFKNNGGFTLVELIVVIAILAILAGVAVPAYSAYISEANKSADNAALEAVETAMASALSMKGKNMTENAAQYFHVEVANGKLVVSEAKTVEGGPDQTTIHALFEQYKTFGGKTEVVLKYYTSYDANMQKELGNIAAFAAEKVA